MYIRVVVSRHADPRLIPS